MTGISKIKGERQVDLAKHIGIKVTLQEPGKRFTAIIAVTTIKSGIGSYAAAKPDWFCLEDIFQTFNIYLLGNSSFTTGNQYDK